MFNKKGMVLILAMVLVFALTVNAGAWWIFGGDDKQEKNTTGKPHEGIKVGITFMTTDNPFFKAMEDAVREEVEGNLNGTLLVSNGQHDAAKQLADVEDMIVQGIELLLLNPVDYEASESIVAAAKEAGIPVVCVDGDSIGDRDIFIASNNYKAGVINAEYVNERLNGKGKVVVINGNPVSAVRNRYNGFMETIKKYPGIEVVAEQNGNGKKADSMEVMENILQAQPKIDAVFAINDPSALGVVAAAQSAGRADEFFVMGVDGAPNAVEVIANNETGMGMAATAAQEPAKIGKLGVEYGLMLLDGKVVPDELPVPVKLITSENAASFSW
ncbi:monosaccharide ABC transporter substrate-binding protein (CUT2 family) [Orenia metallireducens]|jgi:ribose transport system substrate-binding protein|uniref:Monosaccharide ABC transporter substrate-binding protein, CUT2 family n=1 Tax=Orenia metallireducens TaxID=1413210 RepID=A0A285I7E8_9FIRM|nr:substrate-binding domain-containing protein [Orenia metallireducens]PRX22373.1 monosaccharide ABC transporter substrate-binding protein (CUT2 family) [Orenia metallireducens]SNY43910.1 monosaccharide ABC transporter substrate-binding protein, CUT2 family [Orenia metallireducens]